MKAVTTAGIKGIFNKHPGVSANLVNAYFLAKERGIKIVEKKLGIKMHLEQ